VENPKKDGAIKSGKILNSRANSRAMWSR